MYAHASLFWICMSLSLAIHGAGLYGFAGMLAASDDTAHPKISLQQGLSALDLSFSAPASDAPPKPQETETKDSLTPEQKLEEILDCDDPLALEKTAPQEPDHPTADLPAPAAISRETAVPAAETPAREQPLAQPSPRPDIQDEPALADLPPPLPEKQEAPETEPSKQTAANNSAQRGSRAHAAVIGTIVPAYPRRSRQLGEEGVVVVEVVVGPDGYVQSGRVVESSGFMRLDRAALRAAKSAPYEPATRNGRPVSATIRQPFRFKLEDMR